MNSPFVNRHQSTPSLWVYWTVICALLLCQSLGIKHRIEHFDSSLTPSIQKAFEHQSPTSKVLKDHQCSLLDALTLSTCLGVGTYALELLEFELIAKAHFYQTYHQRCAPCFFQPRAPPPKD